MKMKRERNTAFVEEKLMAKNVAIKVEEMLARDDNNFQTRVLSAEGWMETGSAYTCFN